MPVPYERSRDLPSVLPVWHANELVVKNRTDHATLIARLELTERRERKYAEEQCWTYKRARHIALLNCLEIERGLFEKGMHAGDYFAR